MYLGYCYARYLVKIIAFSYLKLSLKRIFLSICLDNVFWKFSCLLYTYLQVSRPNLSKTSSKGSVFVKNTDCSNY